MPKYKIEVDMNDGGYYIQTLYVKKHWYSLWLVVDNHIGHIPMDETVENWAKEFNVSAKRILFDKISIGKVLTDERFIRMYKAYMYFKQQK